MREGMTKRAESTREKIARAALSVLIERGFKESTINEIAQKAGVNEITVFRHFGSKDKLFTDVMGKTIRSRFESLKLDFEPTEDIIRDLTAIGLSLAKYLISSANITRLIMLELDVIPQDLRSYTSNAMYSILTSLKNYFAKAVEKGLISKIDPHLAAVAFYSFFYRIMLSYAFRQRDLLLRFDNVSVRRFVILFAYGIRKDEGTWR
jgi:AcrR family transcriptional regulator